MLLHSVTCHSSKLENDKWDSNANNPALQDYVGQQVSVIFDVEHIERTLHNGRMALVDAFGMGVLSWVPIDLLVTPDSNEGGHNPT